MSLKNVQIPSIRSSVISAGSGVVLWALASGALGGTVWGLARPMEKAQILPDGQAAVLQETLGASFTGTVWFTAVALAVGAVIGIASFMRFPRLRGVPMEVWAGLTAALASVTMVVFGLVVGDFRQPDVAAAAPGQVVEFLPQFDTYVALLVAPLVAMICYWVGLLTTESVESDVSSAERVQA